MCWLCHHCTGWHPILDYRPHVTIRAPPQIPWFLIISPKNCHIPGKTHFQTHIQISDCWLYLPLNPHIPLILISSFFFHLSPSFIPYIPICHWILIDLPFIPGTRHNHHLLDPWKPASGALCLRRIDLLGRIFLATWATNNRWTRGDMLHGRWMGDEWDKGIW